MNWKAMLRGRRNPPAPLSSLLLPLMFVAVPAIAGINFTLDPGTGAPPDTLGGITMTKIPSATHACTHSASPIPVGGGQITVTPGTNTCIGEDWATWSNGYAGDVWETSGALSQTLTLPADTTAFYFYIEPSNYDDHQCSATSGEVSTGFFSVEGESGARYVGFYGDNGTKLTSITVKCSASADGLATGEYGWSNLSSEYVSRSTTDLRSGGSTDSVRITNQGPEDLAYSVRFVNPQGIVQGQQVAKSLAANQSAVNTVGALLQQSGIKTFNPAYLLQVVTDAKQNMTESWLQSVYTPSSTAPPVMMGYTCEPAALPK